MWADPFDAQPHSAVLDPDPPHLQSFHATLALKGLVLPGRFGRATGCTMRLMLTACTLMLIILLVLSLTAPAIFSDQIVALQVHLVNNRQPAPARPPPSKGIRPADLNKYFHEPGDTVLLGHYDVRYFGGRPVSSEERTDTLHHMIRAYLATFRDLNIETWIAHGTLLGWWWNERILPWDSDLDTQVSGQALAYMGEYLNQTTHTYQSGDVERDYFLDVNPYYKDRTRGDGSNIIDARWIDVRNGLFIDITGISEVDPAHRPGVWSCKNEHHYRTDDIWPLRMSYFEGAQALIPNAYDSVLVEEYAAKALNLTEFEGHHWDEKLRLWVMNRKGPP